MLFAMLLIKPSSFILYNLEKNVCSKSLTLLQDIFWNFLSLDENLVCDQYWAVLVGLFIVHHASSLRHTSNFVSCPVKIQLQTEKYFATINIPSCGNKLL